jgi:DNA-binding NtrC family response regulator
MTHRGSILLVDDEEKILRALGRALRDAGHAVVETASPRQAQRLLGERAFDVVIVDNMMPELSGLDLIREYVASTPEGERPQILMMTAHATVESAIEAMKLGALDYLQKPFEIDELLVVVRRALEHQRLRTEYRYLVNERDEHFDHYGIVGRSRAMEEVIKRAELVAETKSTVLITGETGTGKELVARAIHDRSAQRDMPLIKVNCAAIPETLLESELFGHVRGAFTGATTTKKGKFALADGGTIFLDEIGTMSPALQSKLLRVLQEREVRRVGENRNRPIDVRIVTATNKNLLLEVGEKRFREDLYYRLKVVELSVPPLRRRNEDLLPLARLLLAESALHMKKSVEGLSGPAADRLLGYAWPGNVRELANVMERAVAVAKRGRIDVEDLPPEVRLAAVPSPKASGLIRRLDEIEKDYILATLEAKHGNRTTTASLLGIGIATLHRKLRSYKKGNSRRS